MGWRKLSVFVLVLVLCATFSTAVKIQWYGQSAFCISAQDGTKIITDPYKPGADFSGKKLNYSPITTKADIVTVSHQHEDHNYVQGVQGNPTVIQTLGFFTVNNILIRGVPSYHDKEQGSNRGSNNIYCFTVDGVRICHLGDLGHVLNQSQLRQINQNGQIDVLLIPVGGVFTIDATDATKVMEQIKPRIVIPMHYKTDKITIPLKPVEQFTQDKKNVITRSSSTIDVTSKSLPTERQINVLIPAL